MELWTDSNIVFNPSWDVFLKNIENIAYLENLECLTMYTPGQKTASFINCHRESN